ncbi:MAG: tetratricopeptide repeat protein [Oculatellaceae cyanobacterium Prado106]|jgi:tetratricopeptide (TPR) repeat protein|nr:tetratricopeptide repeat protein [Oculatellaceae cyanobacterium Prado106]
MNLGIDLFHGNDAAIAPSNLQQSILQASQPAQLPTGSDTLLMRLGSTQVMNSSSSGWAIFLVMLGTAGWAWQHQRTRKTRSKTNHNSIFQPSAHPLHYVRAAKRFEAQKDYPQAIAIYDEALLEHPQDYRLWQERGLILAKQGRFEEAIASYDQAYALRPDLRDFAHERGDALLELNRYDEAVESFDRFLRYEPNSSHILCDRGYALYQLGRYPEALQSLQQAQKLELANTPASEGQRTRLYEIAALYQLGRPEEAAIAAFKASRKYPDQPRFAALRRSADGISDVCSS